MAVQSSWLGRGERIGWRWVVPVGDGAAPAGANKRTANRQKRSRLSAVGDSDDDRDGGRERSRDDECHSNQRAIAARLIDD
jgi:hypothetical protein